MHPARLLVSLPDVALGLIFFAGWLWPDAFGGRTHDYAGMAVVLEFVVIHSAVVMGKIALVAETPKRRKAIQLLIAGVVYSLFLAALAARFGHWWTLVAFWALIGNRLGNMFLNPNPGLDVRKSMEADWGRSIAFFVLWGAGVSLFVSEGPTASDNETAYVIILTGYYWSQALVEVRRAFQVAFGGPATLKAKRRKLKPKAES